MSQACTCGVRLAVVLAAVLHLDGRQAERLDHLVGALAPVRGAECQYGEGQGQSGQGQREQGAGATGHVLQHGHRGTMPGRDRGEEGVQVEWQAGKREDTECVGTVTDGAERLGQMLWWRRRGGGGG